MKPFNFQLIQWKCFPQHRHPLLSAYEARRLVREPSCYLKIGLNIGRVFAKCVIFHEFVLWITYRLSKSTYASHDSNLHCKKY